MAIKSVSMPAQWPVTQEVNDFAAKANEAAGTIDTAQTPAAGEAVVYEKSRQAGEAAKATYTRDQATLKEITMQVETKFASLRATVENLFSMQSVKTGEAQGLSYDQILKKYDGRLNAFYQNLKVDESTRLTAQQEISENGFWGVKQTSERAIAFAKALAGGDPSKIQTVRDAIEKGYQAAEKAWGGELPDICKQTQAATLKGLDDWAREVSQAKQTESNEKNQTLV